MPALNPKETPSWSRAGFGVGQDRSLDGCIQCHCVDVDEALVVATRHLLNLKTVVVFKAVAIDPELRGRLDGPCVEPVARQGLALLPFRRPACTSSQCLRRLREGHCPQLAPKRARQPKVTNQEGGLCQELDLTSFASAPDATARQ